MKNLFIFCIISFNFLAFNSHAKAQKKFEACRVLLAAIMPTKESRDKVKKFAYDSYYVFIKGNGGSVLTSSSGSSDKKFSGLFGKKSSDSFDKTEIIDIIGFITEGNMLNSKATLSKRIPNTEFECESFWTSGIKKDYDDILEKIKAAYTKAAAKYPFHILNRDGGKNSETVAKEIVEALGFTFPFETR